MQISAEAAYLYDAVHLYANALIKVLESGEKPKNGTAIIEAIKGSKYLSAMGYEFLKNTQKNSFYFYKYCFHFSESYHVYIDENGDAAGNYTVLALGFAPNSRNQTVPGLIPVGTFGQPQADKMPVSIVNIKIFIFFILSNFVHIYCTKCLFLLLFLSPIVSIF